MDSSLGSFGIFKISEIWLSRYKAPINIFRHTRNQYVGELKIMKAMSN
jgi:hypothetical protein